jgi:oligopeptide/dipeptide ABC transporter ATP-binding protein
VDVRDLRVYFSLDEGTLKAVDGVSFSIAPRETLGIIGESGCGKSVTARSILRIIREPGRITGGSIRYFENGEAIDLTDLDENDTRLLQLRGGKISMIFQEPMTSLSPVHNVGQQIGENLLLHTDLTVSEVREKTIDLLHTVGIPNSSQRVDEYPHQLSGGMRQRVMIAMAIACNPRLLIADEPTTALDVTVQAQIIDLLTKLQDDYGMAVMYITHDLGVIAETAHRVDVMYLGRIVESGSVYQVFDNPLHPYTRRLLKSIPKVGRTRVDRLDAIRGTVPTPLDPPRMCGFFSRCDHAIKGVCDVSVPTETEVEEGHSVSCFLHGSIAEEPEVPENATHG